MLFSWIPWSRCYVVTYATQKKGSLEPSLLRTVYIKSDPIDYLEGLRASDMGVNFSLIYCDTISSKQHKRYTGEGK